jgi:hypothetical protein
MKIIVFNKIYDTVVQLFIWNHIQAQIPLEYCAPHTTVSFGGRCSNTAVSNGGMGIVLQNIEKTYIFVSS